jgi:hypothetical protein
MLICPPKKNGTGNSMLIGQVCLYKGCLYRGSTVLSLTKLIALYLTLLLPNHMPLDLINLTGIPFSCPSVS